MLKTAANRVRLGTRGSRLALAQAAIVVDSLRSIRKDLDVEVVALKTLGDVLPPSGRSDADGKSAFTGALEEALVEGSIDAAVHSMKDLPSELGAGLVIAAVPPRGDPRDAFVSLDKKVFGDSRRGARIGTSSARRKAQLLALRRDIEVVEIHGNVETRIGKISEEGLDGVVLAAAGLHRIGLGTRVTEYFEPDVMVPAACQGSLAVEVRGSDEETRALLAQIEDHSARVCADAEREFSRRLGGDCYVPLGAHAGLEGGKMRMSGMVSSPDGARLARAEESGDQGDGLQIASRLAERVLSSGGKKILEELRG